MSTPTYKVVTKVNVTLQIDVQPFNETATLDEIDKAASKEAIEIARKMIRDHNPGSGLCELVDAQTPKSNCSCHISPPCNDCVDNGGTRELIEHWNRLMP